jgi:hypothetical protein
MTVCCLQTTVTMQDTDQSLRGLYAVAQKLKEKAALGHEHEPRAGTRQRVREEKILTGEEVTLSPFATDFSVR